MAVAEDPTSCCSSSAFVMDETYEFSAPRFFDFLLGETDEDMRQAELWFDSALSYAPSPFMPRIKAGRSVQLESFCDFSDGKPIQKAVGSSCTATSVVTKETSLKSEAKQTRTETEIMLAESRGDTGLNVATILHVSADEKSCRDEGMFRTENGSVLSGSAASSTAKVKPHYNEDATKSDDQATEACTSAPSKISQKANRLKTDSKKQQTAKKIASMFKNPSALKSKNQLHLSQSKSILKPASIRRDTNLKKTVGAPNFAQENQAIKRQKLEGGKSRQILNIKPQTLPHKLRPALSCSSNICSSTSRTSKEDRKMYVREMAAPFVSMAETLKKFQSNTREMSVPSCAISGSFPHDAAASIMQRKPKLTLTRPKEPKFETAQRVRFMKVKSSAELEEEMMAKMPKFKARPLNKKILETPTLPAIPRSTPQLPEFLEFHLETMARANQCAETSTVASIESSCQSQQWRPHLTAPKSPLLQTSLRARPPKIKSSVELEKEELENFPKFKARPLNEKILESKGDMGLFCSTKRQITVPREFHFATDERIPQPATVADLFDKLSLNSDSHHDNKELPRNTVPAPFHLHTEERGVEKAKRFFAELFHKQLQEERARIPKANPYPCTTDYPVVPPKPDPKQYTKPEPFQLESLVRHEEEMQREMEERQRIEMEEAQMKVFKAQPILEEDPIPVPEKVRKPLTQVQEFNLRVEHRAVDRAEFDKKIKEKEMMYKRYREEAESEKKMEEEKALKQLRRTLVPHARPVPNFANTFLPQKSSKEVTKPKSPKLNVLRRKEKKSFWGVAAVSSAASSGMRGPCGMLR